MFTQEELQLIKQILINAPIQGTIQTLPVALETITSILQKIEDLSKVEQLKSKP